ncbi:MAG: 1-(5-phosphoribosyl)-5-[(5-phosphoribosylamino)methylideneamino]imidazole-4-carboxamide isomerase [Chloroflexi bacterium]|nr:1-(5-phosphoribosyl)-5-[(5-phosphoribosylamino)methylideneamino]imidazole-4-carboxamide isomerase [Chloroflexota bacterium]
MLIYPAIDLLEGKVVRLREGDPDQRSVFSADPVATAKGWIDSGAEWLHMVSLDGTFGAENQNLAILEKVALLNVRVQFTGGLRDIATLQSARDAGANRLVIGTMAVRDPAAAGEAIDRFGAERVAVALDARDGKVATHGWTELSQQTPVELGRRLRELGAVHALYTDISRDGGMAGVNIADTVALAQATGLKVIASGGVSALADIEQLARSGAVAGAIIGMALYRKTFTLEEALSAAGRG